MQNQTLARRYATAIFRLASVAKADLAVGRDLAKATQAIYANDDVRRFYLSPVFERKKKEAVLLAAFEDKLHEIALHSLLLLVRKRRESLLPTIAAEYRRLGLEAAGKEPLELVTARPLSAQDTSELLVRLESAYRTRFEVTQRTDPALLGGLRITLGDRRIDGSLAARLDELARNLYARPPASDISA